jgi:hypothetical protein
MKDGAIKGKNNVKMGHGKQFLRSAGDCNYFGIGHGKQFLRSAGDSNYFGIGPENCRYCGILVVCQQN